MPITGSFRVKTGYLTAFLLLLLSYFLIFITLQQLVRQSKWVEHTDLVINNLESLSAYINETENSARGYLLFNDSVYLETFYSDTKQIDSLLKNIDSITGDNLAQQKNSDSLKILMQEKLGRMYRSVLLFKQSGSVVTDAMRERAETGKALTGDIRNMIRKMETSERDLLRLRKEHLRGVFASINIITITSLIIALILSVYSFITYSRESVAKARSDGQANSYRNQLEKKIRELQAANKELQELRSLEKFTATGRIARTIAHEIRNPLTNISLASEQIRENLSQDEETGMLLEMINRNASRINKMISDLLTSTRFGQLQYSKIVLNNLIDETLELARDRMELKQITLKKNYSNPGCKVFVDTEKMKIAFLNIIVNAVEAMEKEGILEITTGTENGECLIEFKDNGCGMNEETLLRVFDPYFTNKSGGNGLGLTNTQNIIFNHKGNIRVKSRPGEGTVFSVSLQSA